MKEEFSFLEIFRDPILTIIALILIGTVWMIIPGESKPLDPQPLILEDEIRSLKGGVRSIEEMIKQLEMEIQRIEEEIAWLEREIEKKLSKEKMEDAEHIRQKIAELQMKIERKKKERRELESELERALEKLAGAEGKDDIVQIQARIDKLRREIEKKRRELDQLEEQMKKARQDMAKIKEEEDKQKKLIARLQNDLNAKLRQVEKLEAELDGIESPKPGGGFRPVFDSDKEPFYIELKNNCLFPVDEDHYDVQQVYLTVNDGSVVPAVEMTTKSSVKGEGIGKIGTPQGDLYKVMKKLNPQKERVLFLVHGDSFEIFRMAREIVSANGFETGWWPYEKEAIIGTYHGTALPSTERRP